jgi:hypothetical protein
MHDYLNSTQTGFIQSVVYGDWHVTSRHGISEPGKILPNIRWPITDVLAGVAMLYTSVEQTFIG